MPSFIADKVSIGGVDIGGQRLLALVVGVLVLCVLWLFIQRTRLGAAILAVSQDPEAAQYMGIPTNRIFSIVMAISAGDRGAGRRAGRSVSHRAAGMGLLPMVKAFAIVIVGGLGSIPGSILAALLLGYSETIVAYLISSSWTELVSLVAVVTDTDDKAVRAPRPAGGVLMSRLSPIDLAGAVVVVTMLALRRCCSTATTSSAFSPSARSTRSGRRAGTSCPA